MRLQAVITGRILVILAVILLTVKFLHNYMNNQLQSSLTTIMSAQKGASLEKNQSVLEREAFMELQSLPTTDQVLLEYVRQLVVPPSKLPYVFTDRSKKFPSEFIQQLDMLFPNKTDGFFIECGANDGEFFSNTLELEKKGWTGLLVEAHPELAKSLLAKHRKAWFANVCLSPYNNVSKIEFAEANSERDRHGIGKVLIPDTNKNMKHYRLYGTVRCFPLVTIMAAMGVTHVDYLSLDVEGVELKILQTLPFDDTVVIDYIQLDTMLVKEGERGIRKFLESKNYTFLFKHMHDVIYKRKK